MDNNNLRSGYLGPFVVMAVAPIVVLHDRVDRPAVDHEGVAAPQASVHTHQLKSLHSLVDPTVKGDSMLKFIGLALALAAGPSAAQVAAPRIYIQPQQGFESYIAAAIVKKHVPVVVTQNHDEAQYILTSAVLAKEESAGSKVARCLFLYCAGITGTQTATVQLVDNKTQEVAWAYNVMKGSASAYQSTAEAIAKHLKRFLEEHPR